MKYRISIRLSRACGAEFDAQIPYYNSGSRRDVVHFGKDQIVIEAVRKHRIVENDVFMNLQCSLYNQLVKVLLVHYCQAGSRAGISCITVCEVKATGLEELFCRSFAAAKQPFAAFDGPVAFDWDALKELLGEDADSFRLRIVVMHWLSQGRHLNERQRRLESLWRTFERLCEYHQHQPLDKRFKVGDGLESMITELMTHAANYPCSAAAVSGESVATLRGLRWQEMIRNNYPETAAGGQPLRRNYRDYKATLIDPFFDERAVQLMLDVLVYRRGELQRYGLYTTIDTDLRAKLTMHQRRDMDVVALLCHYIYFLRNRLFHGQLLLRVSVFDDAAADTMRLDFLNNLLATLCVELVNNARTL